MIKTMNNNIKERPILFSADMVRALIREYQNPGMCKNQTRRTRGLERFNALPEFLKERGWEIYDYMEEEPGLWLAISNDESGEFPDIFNPWIWACLEEIEKRVPKSLEEAVEISRQSRRWRKRLAPFTKLKAVAYPTHALLVDCWGKELLLGAGTRKKMEALIRTSVTLPSAGALGGGNYSKIAGYSLPVKFSGGSEGSAFKISMLIGGSGQFEEYPDAGIDDFRLRPVVGSAADITRLVDVTLYYDNGYKARVRELIGIGSPKRYVVRSTLSNLDYNSNTNPCSATYRIVIAQSEIGHGDALAAGVWLVMGGLSNDTIIRLADIRCWDTYHVLYVPVIYLDAQAGLYGGVISAESPTIINGVGGNTYVRFGLEPYQRSWITNVTEEPYTEPEQPTE